MYVKKYEKYETFEISINSKNFPSRLLNFKYPPKTLYYRGNIELLEKRLLLAVVGTRKPTDYGKKVVNEILSPLSQKEIIVVSGLAYGIDYLAHKTALKFGGNTIAVMAGGLDKIYPDSHKSIANEIVNRNGLIISEHPDKTSYLRQHFPARNRIIAGISDSILVVEAQNKSGSLITANFGIKEGKKVFAIPGSIFSKESEGTNHLFNKGAFPVQNSTDIFSFCKSRKVLQAKKSLQNEDALNLDNEEKIILNLLSYDFSLTLSEIIRKSNLKSKNVISKITELELKGLLESVDGGAYRKS